MKKIITLIVVLIVALSSVLPVYAADGKVTYSGNAGNFIFEPGSEHSPTDLFPNFKDVMPGDTLTQNITLRNDASKKVKIDVYMRALGAHEDSVEFLSQLQLQVIKGPKNVIPYMFDAAADEKAQLSDWVLLGTLYSGGEIDLEVILSVPVELDNQFQSKIGYLDWEFRVEEFPVEEDDPKPPYTGDDSKNGLWITLMLCSLAAMVILLIVWRKKEKKKEEGNENH